MIQAIQTKSFAEKPTSRHLAVLVSKGRTVLKDAAGKLKLRSRRGDGNMLWTVLMLALVAGVATISIVAMAPKMKELGTNAAAKVAAIPANWP